MKKTRYFFIDTERKKLLQSAVGSPIYFTYSLERAEKRLIQLQEEGIKAEIRTFKTTLEANQYCNPGYKEDLSIDGLKVHRRY